MIILLSAGLLSGNHLHAQDYRVFTRIYDLSQSSDAKKAPIIVRSITLFHAGKAYDFLPSLGEVSIFDPAHDQFIILNTEREIATTVHFDQIKHHLKSAQQVIRERLQSLQQKSAQNQLNAQAAIENLKFQLAPNFEESYK